MRASRNQATLTRPCTVSGRGYWTGQVNTLTFKPAPVGTGVCFERTDLAAPVRIPVDLDLRTPLQLRTRLHYQNVEVDMIEHVMAALAGLQIDNVIVQCTAAEMPGMDGSSLAYSLALLEAGRMEQAAPRATFAPTDLLRVGDEQRFIEYRPPADSADRSLTIEYQLDYGARSAIGAATYASRVTPAVFHREIAPARTFVTQAEADALQAQGLGLHVTPRDLLVFAESGPVENSLRFEDECARHKALDLIGDLALAGVDLLGHVVARCSGHQMNGQMADLIHHSYLTQDQPAGTANASLDAAPEANRNSECRAA